MPRRLVAVAVTVAVGIWQPYLLGTLLVLLGLIVAHEAGHFVAARRCGMATPAFSVGFGPVIWGRTIGSTTWLLRALPMGGLVHLLGMDERERIREEDEPGTYRAQRAWRRIVVSAAGPAANLLCAGLLLTILYMAWGRSSETMTVELVQHGSPAEAVGIAPGDRVIAIDGVRVGSMAALREVLHGGDGDVELVLERHEGSTVAPGRASSTVAPERASSTLTVELSPNEQGGRRVLGIATEKVYTRLGIAAAVHQAADDVVRGTGATFARLAGTVRSFGTYLVAPLTGDAPSGDRMVSAVGIAAVAREVRFDVPWLIRVAAAINISLATFNLLPVPPLDGGHIAVASIEGMLSRIRRRRTRVHHRLLVPVALAVWAITVLLGLSAVWLDLAGGR